MIEVSNRDEGCQECRMLNEIHAIDCSYNNEVVASIVRPQRGKDLTPRIVLEPTPEPDYLVKCPNCGETYNVRRFDNCICEEMK